MPTDQGSFREELQIRLAQAGDAEAMAAIFEEAVQAGEGTPSRAGIGLYQLYVSGQVGVHERHGQVRGEWQDVVVVERLIGAAARPVYMSTGRPEEEIE